MTIAVLLFARYGEAASSSRVEVEVPAGATMRVVWDAVRTRVPALRDETRPLLALNRSYAAFDQAVGPDDEVAAFPPVSGG